MQQNNADIAEKLEHQKGVEIGQVRDFADPSQKKLDELGADLEIALVSAAVVIADRVGGADNAVEVGHNGSADMKRQKENIESLIASGPRHEQRRVQGKQKREDPGQR